jgi:hypothetical protein
MGCALTCYQKMHESGEFCDMLTKQREWGYLRVTPVWTGRSGGAVLRRKRVRDGRDSVFEAAFGTRHGANTPAVRTMCLAKNPHHQRSELRRFHIQQKIVGSAADQCPILVEEPPAFSEADNCLPMTPTSDVKNKQLRRSFTSKCKRIGAITQFPNGRPSGLSYPAIIWCQRGIREPRRGKRIVHITPRPSKT